MEGREENKSVTAGIKKRPQKMERDENGVRERERERERPQTVDGIHNLRKMCLFLYANIKTREERKMKEE